MKKNKKILVTGGSGYIGSHAVNSLIKKGYYDVVIIDDLSNSKEKYINKNASFVKGSILDQEILNKIFKNHNIEAVMHFAAKISVNESVSNPDAYHLTNTKGTENLINVMKKYKVEKIIFSSTAATYGEIGDALITEETKTEPINPYGLSKLNAENIIKQSGIKYVILRYFNVAGANINDGLKYDPIAKATHLIPVINEVAMGIRNKFFIFGNDYNTKDGTAIRDYVHVQDLVDAHILALESLENNEKSNIFNLSSGKGFSVKEVYDAACKTLNIDIPVEYKDKREGDPEKLIASNEKSLTLLNWTNKYSIEDMIASDFKSKEININKSKPIISFVIPLYGKPDFIIKDLINKINSLNVNEVEFIIVYKNSEKFNYDWMKEMSSEKLVIVGPVREKAQRTYKIIKGSSVAKGKWIQIMDAHHDFYPEILKRKINLLKKDKFNNYDLLISSQKIVKRRKNNTEKVIWTTHPRTTMGIWNGTTLFNKDLFEKYGQAIKSSINISIGDDRTYPIMFFANEPNLKLKYFPKEGYYKQMIYEKNGINTTSNSGWNTKLYLSFRMLADWTSANTNRSSFLKYIGFYWIFVNSFAFYNHSWKGKRAAIETRRIIWNSKLPKRIKWPLMITPWYITSLPYSVKRYRIRKKINKIKKG